MKCTVQIIQEQYFKIDEKKIKIARAEKGWTITKLSKESGVTRKTISEIEKGNKTSVRFSTINRIAKALGKELEHFCSQTEK
ncbi:helix-turn-helix domain-containing protein [Priestia koreensis]|uniref:helix-turn-helix domain-containing protein n=1 Tax=Priestia koreensis TaxID=284581 RepID=UPI00203DD620|nr:helix-turn-helix transcriptional regulator [Priestia koreensis]MCM3006742.1 helix-turn-helix transcriptional regulator [Priestia koreensis]